MSGYLVRLTAFYFSGSEVNISQKGRGWLKINLPLTGWLAQNQVSRISCDSGRNILMKLGLPTIEKLGKKSQQGDLGITFAGNF